MLQKCTPCPKLPHFACSSLTALGAMSADPAASQGKTLEAGEFLRGRKLFPSRTIRTVQTGQLVAEAGGTGLIRCC